MLDFPVSRGEHNWLGPVDLIYYIKEKSCHLLLIQTRDGFRKKGYARKTLDAFLRKMDQIHLPVYLVIEPQDSTTTEEGLERFYTSMGFTPEGNSLKYSPK